MAALAMGLGGDAPLPRNRGTMSQITAVDSAIRIRAFELWNERGCPLGSPERDWLQAEREVLRRSVPAAKGKVPAARPRRCAITKLPVPQPGRA